MRPVLYVILDGLGDRPIPALGDRTPLEAAAVPHLISLARRGRTGLVQTVGVGIAPESDVAVIAILGYDPFTYHTGRGVFEAVGAGIPFNDGDLALRGNFATGKGMQILDRRAGRDLTSEEARALADGLTRDLRLVAVPAQLEVRASIGHRCGVVIRRRGGRLSGKISNTDPAYARVEGLGVAIAQPGSRVERGIAQLTGMSVIPVAPSGEDKATVYSEWARTAAREIARFAGLYIHIKGPDEPGHDGDAEAKRAVIETIDRAFFGTLLPQID